MNYTNFGQYNPETGTYDYDPNHLPPDHSFRTVGVANIGIELHLPTGDVKKINVDDYIHDMTVEQIDGTVKSIKGRLRTVCGSSRFQRFMPRFYNPNGPQLNNYILPQMLVIDDSDPHQSNLIYVPIFSILGVGDVESAADMGVTVIGTGDQYRDIQEVINELDPGAKVELLSGTYTDPLVLNKSISITARGEATLTGAITIGEAGSTDKLAVELNGLDLTEGATITVNHATSFVMDNCIFKDHDLQTKTMPIALTESKPCFVSITNCTFGEQNSNSYNLIDIYAYLTENSTISNNKFLENCCVHNIISLYGLDRNADITIDQNWAYRSSNMVRIGFRGDVNGRLRMRKNIYETTDPYTDYAGLFLVQPYGHETVTFYMLDISVDDTINNSGVDQLGYLYAGPGDTPFTTDVKPKVYIDGYLVDLPDRSPINAE